MCFWNQNVSSTKFLKYIKESLLTVSANKKDELMYKLKKTKKHYHQKHFINIPLPSRSAQGICICVTVS